MSATPSSPRVLSLLATEPRDPTTLGAPLQRPWLSSRAIEEALDGKSPELVDDAFALTQRMIDVEAARLSRVEDKAKTLMSSAGGVVGLLLTLGAGVVTIGAKHSLAEASAIARVAFGAILCTGLFGIAAAYCALRAMNVAGNYKNFSQRDVLSLDALQYATEHGRHEYKIFLIKQAWEIIANLVATAEAKATWVWRGQRVFFVFLAALAVTVFMSAIAVAF